MSDWLPVHHGGTWTWAHEGIELQIAQVAPSTRGIDAYVEMRWTGVVPPPSLLMASRLDLMGSRSRDMLASRVDGTMREITQGVDWKGLMQSALYDVIRHHLDGPEPVRLANVEPSSATFILRPLIGAVGATSLLGAGDSGKSMLALAGSCATASGNGDWVGMTTMRKGPVIFVDWEADANTHAIRVRALAAGVGLEPPQDLHYIAARSFGPLRLWVSALARRVADLGVELIVIDSVMLARGGEAAVADTLAFYEALGQLDTPCLLVDHQSRQAITDGGTGSFGSVVNDNSARLRWVMRGGQGGVTLRAAKSNNFGKLPNIGLHLETRTQGDNLTWAKWHHVEPTRTGSLTDRIQATLEDHPGGLRPSDVAGLVAAEGGTVRKTLRRLVDEGRATDMAGHYYPADGPEQLPAPY